MLGLALALLLFALIAGALGFGLVAGITLEAAKIVFVVFLVMAVAMLIFGYRRRPVDYF